ncbi:MAG: hypothetical protein HY664_03435 [Chloroflexi bacterium]|nr:hypothetical protein [Chloroflexota bacterium]
MARTKNMTEDNEPRYHIDLNWYEENHRSFPLLAQGRMCSACQQKLGVEEEKQVPVVDAKSGRVVFETRKVPYGENPFLVIRDCCSKKGDYIISDMSLKEILFRIFLANANQPLTLEQIKERLKDWLNEATSYRDLSNRILQFLLDNDQYYGFRRLSLSPAEASKVIGR